ncbi:MAG: glycine/betaine/sarcosine/D-proline family reductase selenoprotein B [Proteobacteria bacterium]|nr:glycine/betaine/sarcosine/D-proline family reductase selenoprotein B [Pseudomonadota bacterium]
MHIEYIRNLTELYQSLGYTPYRWVVNENEPAWSPLSKPLSQCRLGLVASGGIYVTGQEAFHYKDDDSFRVVPTTVDTRDLRATHFAYDLTHARRDINAVFPLDTLRGLVREKVVGSLADHAFTFMGGIYSTRRVTGKLAPALTEHLLAEQVDALLLVPV